MVQLDAPVCPQTQQTILLVEDESGLRDAYTEAFNLQGYRVLSAENGEEALKTLESHSVDLVLSDLKMPRMGGEELLQQIKARGLDPSVIFLTGYGTIESAVSCLKLGAADYLLKPFDMFQLFKKVSGILSGGSRLKTSKVRVKEIEAFAHRLRGKNDSPSVFKALLHQVKRSLAPDALALFNCSGNGCPLTPLFIWGPAFRDCTFTRTWLLEKVAQTMELGIPIVLGPHTGKRAEDLREGVALGTAAIVPIVGSHGVYGVLALGRSSGQEAYSRDDLHLLNIYSGQAAPYVENIHSAKRVRGINAEIVTSYTQAVEAKDIYTRGHSERVGNYAVILGRALGVTERDLRLLQRAGILHDIGKIGIPDSILNKPTPLLAEEFEIMKRHPVVGHDILSRISSMDGLLPIVYHHHERINGQGYPDGRKGGEIPYFARLLSVVDSFEAMTSDRAYHLAMSVEQAKETLWQGAGTQWDRDIVQTWLNLLPNNKLPAVECPQ